MIRHLQNININNLSRNSISCSGLILISLITLLSSIMMPSLVHSQGVTVSPPRIFFQTANGTRSSQQIHIQNSGSTPLILAGSVKDWQRDSLGTKVYYPPGSTEKSNANWITLAPAQITVPPGASQDITINIRVPDNALPITNSMVFFSQINPQTPVTSLDKNGRKVALSFKLEVGVHIYNTLPSVQERKDIEFTEMKELGGTTDSARLIRLGIKNNGTVITDGQIRLELTNKVTGENHHFNNIPFSMFPNATQLVHVKLPVSLAKGKYQLVAIMDIGDNNELKVAKKEIIYE